MGPRDVTSRDAVLSAMREQDELGRKAFLEKYGFKRATKFVVVHDGKEYDSKALLAAAHRFEHPELGPLPNNFSGGDQTTSRLRSLGFTVVQSVVQVADYSPISGFRRADCAIFDRYPQPVHWNEASVSPKDQALFKDIRGRLVQLADWLAFHVKTKVQVKAFTSLYQANGFSPKEIWCCIYPINARNKSYAIQVALIISARGAEVCLCLGAGRSQLKGEKLAVAEDAFDRVKAKLRSVPQSVIDEVDRLLPGGVAYRNSWRQPSGPSDFPTLADWIAYAAGPSGAQASVSLYFGVDELEGLGPQINDVVLQVADAAGPLLEFCDIGDVGTPELRPLKYGKDTASDPPSSVFDAISLEELASAVGLEIDSQVYRAVVAAIRSGKHVILTGPPGTAKTTLAELICELAGNAAYCSGRVLTTATADWTTYDTIGGLRPDASGKGLEFRKGLFLEAIQAGRWLIVDELNRSNFDRAFGQLFTVLSGQSVVLPYEDPVSKRPIALTLDGSANGYEFSDFAILKIPRQWRIVATMNVFDKSLLFEMSFALMRRFAFIEVPSPPSQIFSEVWLRELRDLRAEQVFVINRVLTSLLQLRSIKDIGPAVFIDMARFAREYLEGDADVPAAELAFQLFYSYLLPQFEGITAQQGTDLYKKISPLVGTGQQRKLRTTLGEVLGLVLPPTLLPEPDEIDEAFETDIYDSGDEISGDE